jgi:hypothetical protein
MGKAVLPACFAGTLHNSFAATIDARVPFGKCDRPEGQNPGGNPAIRVFGVIHNQQPARHNRKPEHHNRFRRSARKSAFGCEKMFNKGRETQKTI